MVILSRLLDPNEREVKRHLSVAEAVNALEPELKELDDEALRVRWDALREEAKDGHDLDELLIEAFALCREASRRTIGLRHFDVQLVGGIVLHQGKIAEMKTGEGKTLVASLALYLNALPGEGVHLVTVNDYLAPPRRGMDGADLSRAGHERRRERQLPCHLPVRSRVRRRDAPRPAPAAPAPGEQARGLHGRHHLRDQLRAQVLQARVGVR